MILDDLLTDVYSKQVCELFTRGSHHRNISVILITQNPFHYGSFCRDIPLNAHYIVAFKKAEIINSSRSWPVKCTPKIVWVYITLTSTLIKKPYVYLALDLTQNTNDGLRFRSHIFPDEVHPIVVYSCVGDEAS